MVLASSVVLCAAPAAAQVSNPAMQQVLKERKMLFYPQEVMGKKKAPLSDKVSEQMPQIMEFWQSHWLKSGGTLAAEDDKGEKKGPR